MFAVLQLYDTYVELDINQLEAGKHIIPVRLTQKKELVLAEKLLDTLLFIDVTETESHLIEQYVMVLPNRLGRAFLSDCYVINAEV